MNAITPVSHRPLIADRVVDHAVVIGTPYLDAVAAVAGDEIIPNQVVARFSNLDADRIGHGGVLQFVGPDYILILDQIVVTIPDKDPRTRVAADQVLLDSITVGSEVDACIAGHRVIPIPGTKVIAADRSAKAAALDPHAGAA